MKEKGKKSYLLLSFWKREDLMEKVLDFLLKKKNKEGENPLVLCVSKLPIPAK